MAIRKELNQEKNRNYHMDPNRPTDIYKYLIWNKQVHERGLIKDILLITASILGLALGFTVTIPVLVYGLLSAVINFECINIQNCSICKYKRCEEALEKRETKKINQNIENYGDAAATIDKVIETSEKLPSLSEIISQMNDPEQLKQLRNIIQEELKSRNVQKGRGK